MRRGGSLDPSQVRALIAPTRQEIVDVLESAGACSVATLASLLGRPADALYYHLRRLQEAGLVTETERRRDGRRGYGVFDLCRRPVRLSYAPPAQPGDIARVVAAAQRLTWREFRRALRTRTGRAEGGRRSLWGGRMKGWLLPTELEQVNRLLTELSAVIRGGGPRPGAEPISVCFLLAPSPAARRGGSGGRGERRGTAARRHRAKGGVS